MNIVRKIREETLNIKSLELTKGSSHIAESIFWILIAMSGTTWFFYFMNTQVRIWNENKIIVNKMEMELSEIDYPAISFCSNSANKYGIAERLGNHLDPNVKMENEFLTWLKKTAVSCYGKASLERFTDLDNSFYGAGVPDKCIDSELNFDKPGCKVSKDFFNIIRLFLIAAEEALIHRP